MEFAEITDRLAKMGSDKWAVHQTAMEQQAKGRNLIIASIGEPEIKANATLISSCIEALNSGRTGYSNGQGERNLLEAIARTYTQVAGWDIRPSNVMCLPGTQTALFAAFATLLNPSDEVLVGDPYYVTYEGLVTAHDGNFRTVDLHPEYDFKMQVEDLKKNITPRTKVLLLTNPHNPTGAVLNLDELKELCEVCKQNNIWLISDEVYQDLIFDGTVSSALCLEEYKENVIVVSSISKSYAAPGFRSGWIIASERFIEQALPYSETMLFGNQPFIADATAMALKQENPIAVQLKGSYLRRAQYLYDTIKLSNKLSASMPKAGMFMMIDLRGLGVESEEFAWTLLNNFGVSTLPGDVFGDNGKGFIRVSLTVEDEDAKQMARSIVACAEGFAS